MRLFITGTDTGVGKTVIAGGLAMGFRKLDKRVGILKPAESGCGEALHPQDGTFLRFCADSGQSLSEIVPYLYALPLAPAVAAIEESRPEIDPCHLINLLNIIEENYDTVIVEGAGGLLVPMGSGLTCGDLAKIFNASLVVVARPNLGTINHTLLTVRVAKAMGLKVKAVVINQHDPKGGGLEQRSNPEVIRKMLDNVPVYTVPPFNDLVVEKCKLGEMEKFPWERLTEALL